MVSLKIYLTLPMFVSLVFVVAVVIVTVVVGVSGIKHTRVVETLIS